MHRQNVNQGRMAVWLQVDKSEGLGGSPSVGLSGEAPGRGLWGQSPQKLEHFNLIRYI